MYTRFFGLNEKPFSITPDPRYLFMSERHGEALAHLVYGVTESGGFIQLTGEVGTGKTTLVRTLLLERMPNNADVAVVLNPQITANEFLATICEELGVDVPKERDSAKALTDTLNHYLLDAHANGRRTILVVDEAQNLTPAVLEQVRMLTNLETVKQKLLQIILIGQPELRELLDRNDLRQLAQRITGRYHLEPLTQDETAKYIEHRLRVAGALGEIFDRSAKKAVYRLSQGIPRLVNVICDRALLGAYALEARRVNTRLVRRAAREVSGELPLNLSRRLLGVAAALITLAVVATSSWYALQSSGPEKSAVDIAQTVFVEADPIEPDATALPDVAEVAGPSLSTQLALASDLTTTDFAFATLFEIWDVEYASGPRTACDQARDAGLACHAQRSSWSGLQQLDRPAVLRLVDVDGNAHDVVLVSADSEQAELSIGGVIVKRNVADIGEVWFGNFTILWRPPSSATTALATGFKSPQVLWLRQSLASIDARYETDNSGSDEFDDALETAVRRFQQDHRLAVDGLAGQQTQIVINSLLAADGSPRLSPQHATLELARD